jgi:GNAT superfamily N-acetyltransferase
MQTAIANQPDREAVEMWKHSVRSMAEPLLTYESVAFDGASGLWGGVLFPLTNHLFLDRPVGSVEDLNRIVEQGIEWAEQRELPWLWAICEPWLPNDGGDCLEERGFQHSMTLTYMTTKELARPVRELPSMEMRRVDTPELALVVSDLNCEAYGIPKEWGRSANAEGHLWLQDAIGFVSFVDGEPASTATVIPGAGCLNVVCVATPDARRGKGYAEAVMRHALAVARSETGLERTVLHATDAGYPIYERMGYNPGVRIGIWALEQH